MLVSSGKAPFSQRTSAWSWGRHSVGGLTKVAGSKPYPAQMAANEASMGAVAETIRPPEL